MLVTAFIASIILILYSWIIISYYRGWNLLKEYKPEISPSTFVSVVIAFRNESENLPKLLECILMQNINKNLFEVILVNDHSEDDSETLVQSFAENKNFKLLNLEKNCTGKKAAIHAGVLQAKGELIVTTDADCFMHPNWLNTIVSFYEEKNHPELIAAPVIIQPDELYFSQYQSVELLGLIGSGAGAIGIKRPILCNAANLAFKKDVYLEHINTSAKKYISGDDIFMLLYAKKNKKNIRFLKSKDAVVYTNPLMHFSSYIRQRIRWVSKSTGYRDVDILFVALVVYGQNLAVLALLVLGFFNPFFWIGFLALLFLKSVVDSMLINALSQFFFKKKTTPIVNLYQILNALLYAFIPVAAFLVPFKWKGRKKWFGISS